MKGIIRDKRGLEFKSAFFSVVIASVMIIAVGVNISEWNTAYNVNLDNDLGEFDKLDEFSNEASRQEGNISVRSAVEGEDFEGTSIRAVFGFLNNIYKPFKIVFGEGGMLDALTDRFSIPDYVRQGVVTLMVFAITFALMAVLFRRPGRSV